MQRHATKIGIVLIAVLIAIIVLLVVRADRADAPTPADGEPTSPPSTHKGPRSIAEENALPGDAGWKIDRPALIGEIAAYAGQTSIDRGGSLDLFVSTMADGAKYEADVFRMGWYGGAGGRLVKSIKNIEGENQGRWDPLRGVQDCKTCKVDPATLEIEAHWKRSLQIKTGDDWVSGYYVVKLHELKTDTSAYAIFVLRDDASMAPMIVQASTNTWQAYNAWGDASLYGSFGADRRYVEKTRRAYRVSYDRPYDVDINGEKQYGAGEFLRWEYNFVRWSEQMGYDMTYTTNVDVSQNGDAIKKHRMFVSLGHDEYWTKQQRDAVEGARDAGVNIAFLGGNEAYWQGRLEPDGNGDAARVLTVYKDATLDPKARDNPKETTVLFRDPPVSRPQSLLSGLAYGSNTQPDYIAWRAANTDSWIFDGSGVAQGDAFPGIVGYEYDHAAVPDERPDNLTVVGSSSVNGFLGSDTSLSVTYAAANGAVVFSAGTIAWSWGLDDYGHESRGAFAAPPLQKVTGNIIARMTQPRVAR